MCSDASSVAVSVQNVSKRYHLYDKPQHRLWQYICRGRRHFHRDFWAVNDISFNAMRGSCVGIIGPNGSGKSTLLQMICGTLTPTQGHIAKNGSVAALLELGSGFNPDFTGAENIYMNGAILGLSKDEIDARFESIVTFANMGHFIDQPVKIYSTGMLVRLAFAIQAQIEPDILIVDEALAVGDVKFQAKCLERLKQLKEKGACILLATHSCEQILAICTDALLINEGHLVTIGKPLDVVNRYMDLVFGKGAKRADGIPKADKPSAQSAPRDHAAVNLQEDVFSTRCSYNPNEYRWGNGHAFILDYHIQSQGELFPSRILVGSRVTLKVALRFREPSNYYVFGFTIKNRQGIEVYGTNTKKQGIPLASTANETSASITIDFICRLAPGDYFVSLGIAKLDGEEIVPCDRRYDSIHLVVLTPSPNTTFQGLADLDAVMQAQKQC
jgi:lipopolysaccharide transport system ATP-binding protein